MAVVQAWQYIWKLLQEKAQFFQMPNTKYLCIPEFWNMRFTNKPGAVNSCLYKSDNYIMQLIHKMKCTSSAMKASLFYLVHVWFIKRCFVSSLHSSKLTHLYILAFSMLFACTCTVHERYQSLIFFKCILYNSYACVLPLCSC